MKSLLTVMLILVTAGSLGYGYFQQSKASELSVELEAANERAQRAEGEAQKQMMMAQEQRKAAEMAMDRAEAARLRAEQAVAACQKRKK